MRRDIRKILALGIISSWSLATYGQSAIEEYGEPLEPLPNVVSFVCDFPPGTEAIKLAAFGATLKVPLNFEPGLGEDKWFYWNVDLKGESGATFAVPFATMHLGEYDAMSESGYFDEFEIIAAPDSNNLNVTVIKRDPQPDDFSGTYWLYFLKDGEFLKIVSYDPVDWLSLFACF
jgi:hypothetical protein